MDNQIRMTEEQLYSMFPQYIRVVKQYLCGDGTEVADFILHFDFVRNVEGRLIATSRPYGFSIHQDQIEALIRDGDVRIDICEFPVFFVLKDFVLEFGEYRDVIVEYDYVIGTYDKYCFYVYRYWNGEKHWRRTFNSLEDAVTYANTLASDEANDEV